MEQDTPNAHRHDWVEASGLRHILRTVGIAVHPAKLGLALAGVIFTFALGWLLDLAWTARQGIDPSAVAKFIATRQTGTAYQEAAGDCGIFETWWQHQRGCVVSLLDWFVPFVSGPDGPGVTRLNAATLAPQPLGSLAGMLYGAWWMFRAHFFYCLIFVAGVLFAWSLAGGAICRMAALQFTRDERPTLAESLRFSWRNLLGGFVLAPCIPVVLILMTLLALTVGGVVLRLPVLGDLIGGLAFFLALLGGFVVAGLVIGTMAGGSFFWPAIAAEGQDAYDAFSRGLSYAFSRPWKTVLYAAIGLFLAGVCWIVVNVGVTLALTATRTAVGFGTSPFGWWGRDVGHAVVPKLDLLWGAARTGTLYAWPDWQQLAWYEYFSAFLVGLYVLLVIASVWAFLASFYLSGSTIVYFLLRRDVDGTDLEEVFLDGNDREGDEGAGAPAATGIPAAEPTAPGEPERSSAAERTPPPEAAAHPPAPSPPATGARPEPPADEPPPTG